GGFYHLKKFTVGPDAVPAKLHWFKWEAYTTWLSGISLLAVVYYFDARVYLLDPAVSQLLPWQGIVVGVVVLVIAWLVYDVLCRTSLRNKPLLLGGIIFLWFACLAWVLTQLLSGRAAYIHLGAAIGTVMVANVFFVIIPAQKEMVRALAEGREPDPSFGANGLLRSRHNNYLTLPVLFTMISSHFPSTYGHELNWLVLVIISVAGIIARHYFNLRHLQRTLIWMLPAAFGILLTAMWLAAPRTTLVAVNSPAVSDEQMLGIMESRCVACHSDVPSHPGFVTAPKNVVLQNIEQIRQHRSLIYQTTVVTQVMPLANLTTMVDSERQQVKRWVEAQ
ncbi:MAG: urate hydroxylase PuuD, partial [Acidiferrobacterales bacterium]|nr:urate hydroxylase PuuD [Acidiferrobacterales bacterium]